MSLNFMNPVIKKHLIEGNFGLEKESLRVTETGNLAHTPHPYEDDPRMERDFCENQTELVTGVNDSIDHVWDEMKELHTKAVHTLLHMETGKEYLWPFSNPPYVLGEDDIPVAHFEGALKSKEEYRNYLAMKYGKKKMLFSGIHFNFSFPDVILEEGFKESDCETLQKFKNQLYLELAKKITKYTWLIVYLTSASPVMDGSFFRDDLIGQDEVRDYGSARCSDIGYWNEFVPLLDYTSLDTYIKSIERYVDEGMLRASSELYYPVRLKPRGLNSLDALKEKGVNHIEFRMLDLNPLSPIGLKKEDLEFIHLLILYLLSLPDTPFDHFEQLMAIRNEKNAAKYITKHIRVETAWLRSVPIEDAAFNIMTNMELFFKEIGDEKAVESIRYEMNKVLHPETRYVVQIRKAYGKNYVEKGLALVKDYAQMLEKDYE